MKRITVIDNSEAPRLRLDFEDLRLGEFFKGVDHDRDDLYLVLKTNARASECNGYARSLTCQGHSYTTASGQCFPGGVCRVDVTITVDGPTKDQCDC